MVITKIQVVEMLLKYINRQMNLSALVDWAEKMMQDADFEDNDFDVIREMVSHIGLGDVREFGLTSPAIQSRKTSIFRCPFWTSWR